MYKKFAAIGIIVSTLTTCASPASGNATTNPTKKVSRSTIIDTAISNKNTKTIIEKQYIDRLIANSNTTKMIKAISKLKSHVGKTWYVFSGDTPAGWDCSGLTMWTYKQLGITLEHRASKQQYAGTATKSPRAGDIVVFTYKGYKSAYHVGIYIGNGKMIHAPKHGHATKIENISKFAGKYSNVSYRNVIITNL